MKNPDQIVLAHSLYETVPEQVAELYEAMQATRQTLIDTQAHGLLDCLAINSAKIERLMTGWMSHEQYFHDMVKHTGNPKVDVRSSKGEALRKVETCLMDVETDMRMCQLSACSRPVWDQLITKVRSGRLTVRRLFLDSMRDDREALQELLDLLGNPKDIEQRLQQEIFRQQLMLENDQRLWQTVQQMLTARTESLA